jgi:hypothetical protein
MVCGCPDLSKRCAVGMGEDYNLIHHLLVIEIDSDIWRNCLFVSIFFSFQKI